MRKRKLVSAGLGATLAAAVAAGVVVERQVVKRRRAGGEGADELGALHSTAVQVLTDDGLELHAEVDEIAPYGTATPDPTRPTLVFVHGYALNLDCWHFQRARFRGKHRMVFYDQRSHGRSDRSDLEHATIDQLGRDLLAVLDRLVPEGPVVLVGHSMGGMTLVALAEQHPELFGDRVVGAALISTTAGGLRTHRVLSPFIPDRIGGQIGPRLVAGLARAPELVDSARRRGSNIGFLVADRFAFGDEVPSSYVEFVDGMLAGTPYEVLAQFFPNFDALDKFSVLAAFEQVPTTIVCGTKDRLTSVGHSRKMASRISGARLVECSGAGHMVILERHEKVNAALAELFERAESRAATEAS
jgi:pimeloyl-ACP methyl ester carboxylesterase